MREKRSASRTPALWLGWLGTFCACCSLLAADANFETAQQSNWQPVECVPSDPPPEALYDVAQPLDDFEAAPMKWKAEQGGQQALASVSRDTAELHDGMASLRVDYDFVGKKDYEYLQIDSQADFPKPGFGFGFWLKHDGTPFAVRLRFVDAGGECHQVDIVSQPKPGWQFVAGLLDSRSSSWGGDGNKRKDYPCKLAGICIDRPRTGFVGKGRLWIDTVGLLTQRNQTLTMKVEIQAPRFGNIYAVGDKVALRASGVGADIRWSVVDFFGRQLAAGKGSATNTEARFTLGKTGFLMCKLELAKDGKTVESREFRCASLPGGRETEASDFAGVCTHFGQRSYPIETIALMRRYGIDQYRDEISWGSFERQKGSYTMPAHAAAFLGRGAELKMRPLLIFDYANSLYDNGGFPNSPEAIEAFAAYAVDLARQTRGSVKMFEVWNEWIGACGMDGRPGRHDGEAYGKLLKPAYEAVKKAFPDLTVVGIGGEYGPKCAENILGAIRTAGPNSMDAWSIHPYRYPNPPEKSDLAGEVNRIAGSVAGAGAATKAWITEIGYPTHRTPGGSDEAAQARLCVRTLALLQSTRSVDKVFWYDLKDDGLDRDYNENNFGLIRHQRFNCAPKPGIVALSVFIRTTGKARFKKLLHEGDAWIACYQSLDGGDLWIAWTEKGVKTISISGKLGRACDIMGESFAPTTGLELTENPIYIAGTGLKADFGENR